MGCDACISATTSIPKYGASNMGPMARMLVFGRSVTPNNRFNMLDSPIEVSMVTIDSRIGHGDCVATSIQTDHLIIGYIISPHVTDCHIVVDTEYRL